jgi:hypothetical protein
VLYPMDFQASAKARDHIIKEWQKVTAK